MRQSSQEAGFRNRNTRMKKFSLLLIPMAFLCFGVLWTTQAQKAQTGVPVFKITPVRSVAKFGVKASVPIEGKFDKWDATLTFTSTDVSTGVLDIKIDAGSVDTGSGMKDGKLKGKDFFDVTSNPYITFHSSKIVQTGPTTFAVPGTFTIRGSI